MDLSELKKVACSAIDEERGSIVGLSRYINTNPETAYKEKKAVSAITGFLSERGFAINIGTGGIKTAFTADYVPGGARNGTEQETVQYPVSFVAEYDALPAIGHGCGHNLIAAAAAAAAIGTADAVQTAIQAGMSLPGGTGIRVVGTPAEEVMTEASGKTRLINAGFFRNTENVLMFHPWIKSGVAVKDLGCTAFRVEFKGRTAHAAADPWNGRNALDAAVLFYNSLSLLRQQLPAGFKLHVILPEGGSVLNVIPDSAVAEVMLRSSELDDLVDIERRIRDCVNSAASAAGCTSEMMLMAAVKPINFNRDLFNLAAANMAAEGEILEELPVWEASSDFGDVSHVIPALSLLYKTHDSETCWHSSEAAAEAAGDAANEAMIRAAKILSATAIDILFR